MTDFKKIDAAIANLNKECGANTVMQLGKRNALNTPVIPTGVLSIDGITGIGGFARGRIVEVYGPESGGKTTLTLQVIGQAQKLGGVAAFIDAEHALDPAYATKLGVNVDALYISQPDNGEQALTVAERLIQTGEFDIVVVDSVAALVPKAELEGEMGDAQMGLQARLMSQAMRKLTAVTGKSKTCLIFINQIREKIGVMFGNPETTTGGRALKFYASQRFDVRRATAIKDGDRVIGAQTKIKQVKNKLAAPFKETLVDLIYGEGFAPVNDLINLAVAQNIVEKSGSWISYGGERLGQGFAQAVEYVKSDPIIAEKITEAVRAKLFPKEE